MSASKITFAYLYPQSYTTLSVGKSTAPNGALDVSGDVVVSGNVNIDSGLLFIDGSNNRVGINTTTPSKAFEVSGNARVTSNLDVSGALAITSTSSMSNNVDISGTSMLRLTHSINDTRIIATCSNGAYGSIESTQGSNNATKRALVFNAFGGNVGIGMTNPSKTFEVTGAARVTSTLDVSGAVVISGTTRLTGNVGIGMTNPSVALDVSGSSQFTGNTTICGTLFVSTVAGLSTQWSSGANSSLYYTNGNIGIGKTNPSVALDVSGDINLSGKLINSRYLISHQSTTGNTQTQYTSSTIPSGISALQIVFNGVSTNGTSNHIIRFVTGGTTEVATGYICSYDNFTTTPGTQFTTTCFAISDDTVASTTTYGTLWLNRVPNTNTWTATGNGISNPNYSTWFCGGSVTLTAEPTNLRLRTETGTPTFDAGSWTVYGYF